MSSRRTDAFGNPTHPTTQGVTSQGIPLGAPGTTGAFETNDPLGAPGSTGASMTNPAAPNLGYDTAGGQEQLHRPTAGVGGVHNVPLHKEHDTARSRVHGTGGTTGTTPTYAYGTAASMEPAGHAGVNVPHHTTTDTSGVFGGGYDSTDINRNKGERTQGARGGQGGGYDTGDFGTGRHTDRGGHGSGGYDTGDFGSTGRNTGRGGRGSGGYDTGDFGASDTGIVVERIEVVEGGGFDTGDFVNTDVGRTGSGGHESKGMMDRIKDHLPGTGGGTK